MDVDSSTASTENRHPDGSSTVVTVHPTGEVIRSVHYTAADGHRVSVSSDGAGGQTEIHTYDGGRVYSEIRKADGSTFRDDTHTEPDGTRVNVSQGSDDGFVSTSRTFEKDGVKTIEKTVPPDAHKETWTEELTALPDGTKMHQVKDFDGTRVNTVEWGTGGEITTTTLPDGTQKQSASWQTEDGWVTRDVDVDGSTTVTQTSTDPVTRWTTTTTTDPDGHQEVRSDRTTEKPDGGTCPSIPIRTGTRAPPSSGPTDRADSMVVFGRHATGNLSGGEVFRWPGALRADQPRRPPGQSVLRNTLPGRDDRNDVAPRQWRHHSHHSVAGRSVRAGHPEARRCGPSTPTFGPMATDDHRAHGDRHDDGDGSYSDPVLEIDPALARTTWFPVSCSSIRSIRRMPMTCRMNPWSGKVPFGLRGSMVPNSKKTVLDYASDLTDARR